MSSLLLECKGLSLLRPGAPLLKFPELSIAYNSKTLLLGPSGCGKTTLLSIIAGLLKPTNGQLFFQGSDFYQMSSKNRDSLRGHKFGFVFQTLHLLPSLTLRQNITLAADMSGRKLDNQRLDMLLATLGLGDKAHRKPSALSQGEQQRAAIARAVLNEPSIILADEPTSALDDINAGAVMELLIQQAQENKAALLISTHDNRINNHFENIIHLTNTVKEAA